LLPAQIESRAGGPPQTRANAPRPFAPGHRSSAAQQGEQV